MSKKLYITFFLLVSLIGLLGYRNFSPRQSRIGETNSINSIPKFGDGARESTSRSAPSSALLSDKRKRPVIEGADLAPKSLNNLINELKSLFDKNEAHRCRLLGESKKNSAQGPATWYLLAVDPPSSEEITAVRKQIANLSIEAKNENKQKFDEWAGDLIASYDPFGTLGKRVIIITIPDDPAQKMSAMTYTSDNFDGELEKIDPAREFDYILPNLRLYSRSDNDNLHRFEALIKSE